MNKFSWICEQTGIKDDSSIRWRVLVDSGASNVRMLFKRHHKLLIKFFNAREPSKETVSMLCDTVKFYSHTITPVAAMACALAYESYRNGDVYDDLWNICKELELRGRKKFKRKGRLPMPDPHETTQAGIITALQNNLVVTGIIHTTVQEAENFAYMMRLVYSDREITIEETEEAQSEMWQFSLLTHELSYQNAFYYLETLVFGEAREVARQGEKESQKEVSRLHKRVKTLEEGEKEAEKLSASLKALEQAVNKPCPLCDGKGSNGKSEPCACSEIILEKDLIIDDMDREIRDLK